jgi:hypothetical protein
MVCKLPVKKMPVKEIFWLQVEPDTWRWEACHDIIESHIVVT